MLNCNECQFVNKTPVFTANNIQYDGYCTLNPEWLPIVSYNHYCGRGTMRAKFDKSMDEIFKLIEKLE